MGTIIGFFAAQLEAFLAGAALLVILRCWRLPYGLLVPTAWLAGNGIFSIEYLLLAQLGLTWTPITVGLPWLPVVALATWQLDAARKQLRTTSTPRARLDVTRVAVDVAVAAAIVLWTAALMIRTFGLPVTAWDAIAMWIYKGHLFYGAGTIPTRLFTDPYYMPLYIHIDYPLLVPLTVGRIYSWIGAQDVIVKGWWSLLVGAAGAGLYFGLEGIIARAARVGGLVLVAGAPIMLFYGSDGLAGYADLPLAVFVLYAAIFLYRWLLSSAPAEFGLSALFFGLTAFTKNEGLILAAAGLVMLVMLGVVRKALGHAEVWFGIVLALLAIVPWEIEKLVLNITGDLHPTLSAVLQNWQGRIGQIITTLFSYASDFYVQAEVWVLLVPLMVAALIFIPRKWLLTLPLLILLLIHFGTIILAFVTTPYDLGWHLATAGPRLIFQVALLAALLSTIYIGILLEGVHWPFASRLPAAAESTG